MPIAIIVAVLNFLGSLLPSLPAYIEQIFGHPDLNDGGKAALTLIAADKLAVHAAAAPLPLPTPKL